MLRTSSIPTVLLVLLTAVLVGACGSGMQSTTMVPRPDPLRVDASVEEWGGALTPVGNTPLLMATSVTDTTLHIALLLRGRDWVRSVAKNGLIVWVDPAGGKRHTYGLRYPIGLRRQPTGDGADGSTPAPGELSWSELAVIRDDTTRRYLPARFSSGLRADVAMSATQLVYEATIPIGSAAAEDGAHGLRAALGPGTSIGVETPQPDEGPNTSEVTANEPIVAPSTGQRPRRRRGRRRRPPQPQESEGLPTLEEWVSLRATDR